jgi:hypothetical protein
MSGAPISQAALVKLFEDQRLRGPAAVLLRGTSLEELTRIINAEMPTLSELEKAVLRAGLWEQIDGKSHWTSRSERHRRVELIASLTHTPTRSLSLSLLVVRFVLCRAVQQQPTIAALAAECSKAGITVNQQVLDRILATRTLVAALQMASPTSYVRIYQHAEAMIGSNTAGHIIACDDNQLLALHGVFEEASDLSSSSLFYKAYVQGSPGLLKFTKSADDEEGVYKAVPLGHPGRKRMVEVRVLPIMLASAGAGRQLPMDRALWMRRFDSTLAHLPSNARGAHPQLHRAATHVAEGLEALHEGGYVHCGQWHIPFWRDQWFPSVCVVATLQLICPLCVVSSPLLSL